MATKTQTLMFVGPIVHSINRDKATSITKAAMVVVDGKIKLVEEVSDEEQVAKIEEKFNPESVTRLQDGQFLIPGLIDTHIHAPQFPNVGLGYDKPLLEWLKSYIFPLESQYSDLELAKRVYKSVVKSTLKCGTTTAVYFGSVHAESCVILADVAHCVGQKALVGKVCMDMNCTPEMTENTMDSVGNTEHFIKKILSLNDNFVIPVITPRFAITCSEELLTHLAQLAAKYNIPIQTHMSENKEEVLEVKRLFPSAENYADVYDKANLLTKKTILAHCVFLEESEMKLLKERGCSIAHCPNSNICLQSGLCDVRQLLDAGLNVALGTDVAGGCNHSMLDAIRSCLNTSVVLSFSTPGYKQISYHEAFYMATMGGAIALDMENELGNFEVGKYFDALIIDTEMYPMHVHSSLTLDELFQKFLYTGDDRNIIEVYVNGKLIKMRESASCRRSM